ncbi:Selenoprotein M [Nibea albiflora]|uniref:Selenoprotein M n=1 Tax=Nibea albiflora TaxID=240163 RepID=A0ACB7FBZ2_NIBAL|nr:Selenoprotein M [Nibea albiflora]
MSASLHAPCSLLRDKYLTWQRDPDVTSLHIISPPPPPLLFFFTYLTYLQTSAATGPGAEQSPGSRSEPGAGAIMWLIVLASLLQCASAYDVDLKKLEGLAKARVEVKAFVVQDIPLYHNLVMKHIPGADPELVLLNHYYEELDRIALSDMTRSEINELLEKLGFYKKAQAEDEVPEEFRFSPAKDSPFKDEPPYKSSTSSLATENESNAVKHTDL